MDQQEEKGITIKNSQHNLRVDDHEGEEKKDEKVDEEKQTSLLK